VTSSISPAAAVAALTLIAVLLLMAGEAVLSQVNERILRSRGAVRGAGDDDTLHRRMAVAYPACFVAMALEGAWSGPAPARVLAAGLLIFGLSKALKLWAIAALGVRWTFRVWVLPATPPITDGPYAWMRHPNYVAIIGEMAGTALIVWAPVTGVLAALGYGVLLRRKIDLEDHALGRQ
jgi:methyltransferase